MSALVHRIEGNSPGAGAEHRCLARVDVSPLGRATITGTGVSALVAACTTYLTPSKASALRALGGSPSVSVSSTHAHVDVLATEQTSMIATLTAILVNPANVTAA